MSDKFTDHAKLSEMLGSEVVGDVDVRHGHIECTGASQLTSSLKKHICRMCGGTMLETSSDELKAVTRKLLAKMSECVSDSLCMNDDLIMLAARRKPELQCDQFIIDRLRKMREEHLGLYKALEALQKDESVMIVDGVEKVERR